MCVCVCIPHCPKRVGKGDRLQSVVQVQGRPGRLQFAAGLTFWVLVSQVGCMQVHCSGAGVGQVDCNILFRCKGRSGRLQSTLQVQG